MIKFLIALFATVIIVSNPVFAADIPQTSQEFQYEITAIPPDRHLDCPVSLNELALLSLSYWGFDHKTHTGTLIINKRLAQETVNIFRELYAEQFPIERMETMDTFRGDSHAAMAANNTSGFNCQISTQNPQTYSLQSHGYALNINTLINPQVRGDQVLPPKGGAYLDRSKPVPGMIVKGDKVYQIFSKYGWTWGGVGNNPIDYSYFAKNPNKPIIPHIEPRHPAT